MRRRALLALLAIPALASCGVAQESLVFRPDSLAGRLFQAVQDGKVETVRALLAKGASPNDDPAAGGPLLAYVGGTPAQMLAIAQMLIAKGAKVDPPFGVGNQTPLVNALNRAQEPIGLVRLLLEKGADPNRASLQGDTPLLFAVRNGFAASVEALLEGGARVDAGGEAVPDSAKPDDPDLRPFQRSGMERSQAQIDHVFEPGYRDSGKTPIFGLAGRFDPTVAARLLKAGARLDERDDNGRTPLHDAVQGPSLDAVRGLLALGAGPNAASKGGFTPLHVAMRTGFGFPSPPAVRLLLAKGADPKAKDREGRTPLDLLRADVQWRLGNPTHDPELAFPESVRAPYLALANEAARLLDPNAAPIVFVPAKPDPRGTTYAPLDLGDGSVGRTVHVENGRAVLELRLPALPEGDSTLTVEAVALEEYDTLTPLPLVVRRERGKPAAARLTFPVDAAKGGALEIAYRQHGPNGLGGGGTVGDGRTVSPGFQYGPDVAVEHDLAGRTLELEILSATHRGKSLPGFAGRRLRVEGGKPAPIAGLRVDPSAGPKAPKTTIRYRWRFLPNVRWHTDSMPLG